MLEKVWPLHTREQIFPLLDAVTETRGTLISTHPTKLHHLTEVKYKNTGIMAVMGVTGVKKNSTNQNQDKWQATQGISHNGLGSTAHLPWHWERISQFLGHYRNGHLSCFGSTVPGD